MSTISSVSSATGLYQPANQGSFSQSVQDFQAIGSALQSGDLTSAQSALAAFQQDLPASSQTSSNQPFGANSKANSDYQSLVSALQSGNLSNAQQSFASLQTDLKATSKSHHHHHHSSSTTSSTTAASSTTTGFTIDDASNGLNVTA
jgi:hypothetical protein